jgi:hypothetical protein
VVLEKSQKARLLNNWQNKLAFESTRTLLAIWKDFDWFNLDQAKWLMPTLDKAVL